MAGSGPERRAFWPNLSPLMGTDGQDLSVPDALAWYDTNARKTVERHEALNPAAVNAWLEPFLPPPGGLVADVGAGAGRDAAWLGAYVKHTAKTADQANREGVSWNRPMPDSHPR
jgi:hypothetical protein